MHRLLLAGVTLMLVVGYSATALAEDGVPFRGLALPQVLQPTARVSCLSNQAATIGYYRNVSAEPGKPEVTLTHSPLRSQTTGDGYKISIEKDQATVNDEATKRSDQFHVYRRDDRGLILIRLKGVGVEVITVDPQNGSFVLTDAGVQMPWNRTNVWVGPCIQALGD